MRGRVWGVGEGVGLEKVVCEGVNDEGEGKKV